MKHTPTPWRVSETNIISIPERTILFAGVNLSIDQQVINSQYIVQCVNSHDELLEIAKAYLNTLNPKFLDYEKIEKAIQKAEGK